MNTLKGMMWPQMMRPSNTRSSMNDAYIMRLMEVQNCYLKEIAETLKDVRDCLKQNTADTNSGGPDGN